MNASSTPGPAERYARFQRNREHPALTEFASLYDFGLVVANGLLPQRFTAADARALERAPHGPPVRAARPPRAPARAHRAQLRRLRRGARASVATLPFVFDGDPMERLTRELERAL